MLTSIDFYIALECCIFWYSENFWLPHFSTATPTLLIWSSKTFVWNHDHIQGPGCPLSTDAACPKGLQISTPHVFYNYFFLCWWYFTWLIFSWANCQLKTGFLNSGVKNETIDSLSCVECRTESTGKLPVCSPNLGRNHCTSFDENRIRKCSSEVWWKQFWRFVPTTSDSSYKLKDSSSKLHSPLFPAVAALIRLWFSRFSPIFLGWTIGCRSTLTRREVLGSSKKGLLIWNRKVFPDQLENLQNVGLPRPSCQLQMEAVADPDCFDLKNHFALNLFYCLPFNCSIIQHFHSSSEKFQFKLKVNQFQPSPSQNRFLPVRIDGGFGINDLDDLRWNMFCVLSLLHPHIFSNSISI